MIHGSRTAMDRAASTDDPPVSDLMDSVTSESAVAVPPAFPDQPPRVWKFWGTTLWGCSIFVAMFLGQLAIIIYFVFAEGRVVRRRRSDPGRRQGLTISLSVILGLPAVLLATWSRSGRRGSRLPTIWRCAGLHGVAASRPRRSSSSSAARTCCRARSGAR